MDEEAVMEFAGGVLGAIGGMALATGVWLGDEAGLYRAMAGAGPQAADAIADAAGCNRQLVGEWLNSQAAAGFIEHDGETDTYALSDIGAMVLADDSSPVFMARGVQSMGAAVKGIEKLIEAFKGDGAMSWGDHHPCLFKGVEWFFKPAYRASLAAEWIPAMDGVAERLEAGAAVAEVGCGHGAASMVIAEAFPKTRVTGVDFHGPSIDAASRRVADAGFEDRVSFQVADAKGYEGTYDLICFIDCLHDMGDPVGAARYAREHLTEGGSVMLVEPFALDGKTTNMAENPLAAMMYAASSVFCVPNSVSQEVGLGLGAQAGPGRLTEVCREAGFSSVHVAAQTPFNLVLQAK